MSPLAHEIMLSLAHGDAISGGVLAQQLGCSRAAVWKQIQALRSAGVQISASSAAGYQWQQPVTMLDAGEIFAGLQPAVAARLQHLQCLPACSSTNAELAAQGHTDIACCVSEYQQSGRGRRGRHWSAPAYGSLLLSLRWEFSCGANALALLGVRAGLLLRSMLQDLVTVPIALKWPNDVVVMQQEGAAKLAGILIEMQGSMDGPCTVIIGIGINVGWAPECLQQLRQQLLQDDMSAERQAMPPVDLRSLGCEPARNRIAAVLINRLAAMCIQYEQGLIAPAAELVASWRQHDLLYGKRIQVSTGQSSEIIVADGVAHGIDASGAYLVQSGDQTHAFHAAAISLRPWQQTSA